MCQVIIVNSEVLDISANSGGRYPLHGCFSPPNVPHTQFPVATGTNLKQQFRNGVSEPIVGLVQFSQDIFLMLYWIIWPLCGSATLLTQRPFLSSMGLISSCRPRHLKLPPQPEYKENCSAPMSSLHHPSFHRVKLKRGILG